MAKENIHVALSCDDAYAHYCAETIVSLLLNTKNENIFYHFYIMQRNLLGENRKRIAKLKNIPGNSCTIEFLDMHPNGPAAFKDPMFYRLRLASMLPELDRIIYTDCDVTFLDDLGDIWHEDVDNYYSGNCVDWTKDRGIIGDHFLKICKVSEDDYSFSDHEIYFNSGFMVMNLVKIREDNVEERCAECIDRYPDLRYKDQDVINLVYYNRIKPISFRWSFMISYYTTPKSKVRIEDKNLLADLRESAAQPKMVHFVANKKPNNLYRSIFHIPSNRIVNKYKKLFWQYIAYTDWKNEKNYRIIYRFPLNFLNLWT
ncbi:MAG: glycosyltransferase family 8 protein [Rickettsiales bacterium]|jgi:lipopolysaccharide biosynthesis glycosyltransferase|nr:glycosyltransferase family 8 protein [Rickettsiales bacterium]